jgi:hypothetical protein
MDATLVDMRVDAVRNGGFGDEKVEVIALVRNQ